MTGWILLGGALLAAAISLLLLRSLGMRYRVGRLLAAAPLIDIDEALQLATGAPRYVRVTGRISSEEEFPDEHDRPLVFRRKRIDIDAGGGKWRTIADEREAVAFGVEARDSYIAVDENAITDGLVAIPRESAGKLADLPKDMLEGMENLPSPDSPARLLIEQVSAVEHATICGTPVLLNGQPTMTAGAGRPLIVTTLEAPAAMRLLASGRRPRVLLATALLLVALFLLTAASVVLISGL